MNPIDDPDAYDFADVGGQRTPGLVEFRGAADKRKWDKQDGKGQSGGTAKFGGRELEEFDMVVSLWQPQHFDEWRVFSEVLREPDGANAKSLSIAHPILSDLKITIVNVVSISQLTRVDETGLWQYTVRLMRASPATPSTVVPSGATGNVGAYLSRIDADLNRTERDDILGALAGGPNVGLPPPPPPTAEDEQASAFSDLLNQFNSLGS